MAKVYISSTYEDLKDERKEVAQAIRVIEHHAFGMEDYLASDQRPLDKCIEDVKSCDAYVGIIARRYGYVLESHEKSITHLEYQAATEANIPRFIFMLSEEASWPDKKKSSGEKLAKLKKFREQLQKEHTVYNFNDSRELAIRVPQTLLKELPMNSGVPDFLPYLADRSEAEFRLKEAFKKCRQTKEGRPLICLIHGNEAEAHDRFLERLERVSIAKLLERNPAETTVKRYSLKWPPNIATGANCSEILREYLSDVTSGVGSTSIPQMNKIMADLDAPVMIESLFFTEDWAYRGREITDAYLQFWNDWPAIHPGQLLIVCLCVKYRPPEQKGLLGRMMSKDPNLEIRKYIEALDSQRFDQQYCVSLELSAVQQQDVEEWAKTQDVSSICNVQMLIEEIGTLFKKSELCTEAGHIRMQNLGRELKSLLIKHRC